MAMIFQGQVCTPVVLAVLGVFTFRPVVAAPTFQVKSSTTQIRKSQPFKLFLTVSAADKMDNLHVSLLPPTGFTVTLENKDSPSTLELGIGYTMVYHIDPPASISLPGSGGDTRESKTFVFNIDYQSSSGVPHQVRTSTDLTLPYSINPAYYLLFGTVGLIVGNILKVLTKNTQTGASWEQAL